jgi:signal transduction histidine kinase
MFQNKNLSVIGSNLLFKGLDESAIKPVFNLKNFRAEKEGMLIFQAGEESDYLYLILQGEVKIKYSGVKGSNASFRRIKNEFFGEQEVLEKTNRITSAVADTDCIFYLISKNDLFSLISQRREILKNLSFTPVEEEVTINDEEFTEESQPEQNAEEKQTEEIIMDEDLADYSYDSQVIEELPDFNNDNYLSYSENDEDSEDLNFNNNGFHDEENQFDEKASEEILADYLQKVESNDIPIPEQQEENSDRDLTTEEELVPAINDFEHIPEEPQKFAFDENDAFTGPENSYREDQQPETETLTLIESTSKFINNNILFPLNEIKKLSDLLGKSTSLPEVSQVNELIKRNTNFVQSIVSTSLAFVSQENNQTLTRQNVKNLLTNVLDLLSVYVESRKVKFYKKIETEAEIEADEVNLYNVFFQLAKNACDSMPEGGNIFVTAFKKDSDVKIEFVDEGIGIPSSLTFEIFEPMLSHGKQDGTGLGLSIARKIIQDHKGDISVDGELGEGTKIILNIPVAKARA